MFITVLKGQNSSRISRDRAVFRAFFVIQHLFQRRRMNFFFFNLATIYNFFFPRQDIQYPIRFFLSTVPLKVHKIENFLTPILEFALFLCQLCKSKKILVKHFFDWTIMGGATIILRGPRTTQNEKKFQDRPKDFFVLNHI